MGTEKDDAHPSKKIDLREPKIRSLGCAESLKVFKSTLSVVTTSIFFFWNVRQLDHTDWIEDELNVSTIADHSEYDTGQGGYSTEKAEFETLHEFSSYKLHPKLVAITSWNMHAIELIGKPAVTCFLRFQMGSTHFSTLTKVKKYIVFGLARINSSRVSNGGKND